MTRVKNIYNITDEDLGLLKRCQGNPKFDHLYADTPSLFRLITKKEFEEWSGIKEEEDDYEA